ncbi:MAG: hypothetical protein QW734_04640 [Candidatus Bathyarchaeia archaeon]
MATPIFKYDGEWFFKLPLPGMFKDAFKIVVGEHQFSHQYAMWRAISCLLGDYRVFAWGYPYEEISGVFKRYLKEVVSSNLKFFFYNLTSEYLTNVFYRVQEGKIGDAYSLLDELNNYLNKYFNLFAEPGYIIQSTVKIYTYSSTPYYMVLDIGKLDRSKLSDYPYPRYMVLNRGVLDYSRLAGVGMARYRVVVEVYAE